MLYFQFELGMVLPALSGAEIWGGSVAGTFYQRVRRVVATTLLALAPLALTACMPSTYATISLRRAAADAELQAFARQIYAAANAQFEQRIVLKDRRGDNGFGRRKAT